MLVALSLWDRESSLEFVEIGYPDTLEERTLPPIGKVLMVLDLFSVGFLCY